MNLFFDLPEEHQVCLLTTWLSWRMVGRLDSALCCVSQRKLFRNIASSECCIFDQIDPPHNVHDDVAWVMKRRMKFRAVELRGSYLESTEVVTKTLEYFGHHLHSLTIYLHFERRSTKPAIVPFDTHAFFTELVKFCPNVKNLVMKGNTHGDGLTPTNHYPFLPRQLESLYLDDWNVPSSFMCAILDAPNLRELYIHDCAVSLTGCGSLEKTHRLQVLTTPTHLLCSCFPNLVQVRLKAVHAAQIATVLEGCHHLYHAEFMVTEGVIDVNLASKMAQTWSQLTTLKIYADNRSCVTEDAIVVFVSQCRELIYLFTTDKANESVEYDADDWVEYKENYRGSKLRTIAIVECAHAATLQAIVQHCRYLYTLHLYHPDRQPTYTYTLFNAPTASHVNPPPAADPVEKTLHYIHKSSIGELGLHDYANMTDSDLLQLQNWPPEQLHITGAGTITDKGLLTLLPTISTDLHTLKLQMCKKLTSYVVLQIPSLCSLLSVFWFVDTDRPNYHGRHSSYVIIKELMKITHPHITDCFINC